MRVPSLKPLRVIRALQKLGFERARQNGGHLILMHRSTGKIIAIPMHAKDLKRGLLFGIIKQAGISKQEFIDLL